MRRIPALLLSCLFLAAAGGALSGCASLGEPAWFAELRAREAAPLSVHRIGSPDRFFRARIPAKPLSPVTRQDEAYAFQLDVGGETPVECWVHRESIDPAGSLSALSEATFSSISENLGKVDLRHVDRVDAGAFGASPYLAVDWLYRIASPEGPRIGVVKHLVANKDGRGVYCQHNEVGYGETFRRVAAALVESLETRQAPPRPYFSQISTLTIRGVRVGIEHTALTRDEDGDTRVDTRTSLLIPVDGATLQASDSFGIEFARPDGALINQVHVESANGEIVSHLTLDPHPGGVWAVNGTFQTKPISAQVRAPQHPTSWLGEALALRRTLATSGTGGEITLQRWVPQADPTRLVDETLSIGRELDPGRFGARLEMAGLAADLVVERSGSVASASMEMGPASMDVQRVYVDGAL